MIQHFTRETKMTFSVLPPLYLPFYNQWGANKYYTYSPFSYNPFDLPAISTSGSPVVLACGSFFGFMDEDAGGTFSYDGCGTLTITCPAGQSLYYNEDCNPHAEWMEYNKAVLEKYSPTKSEDFWGYLEYCTWVEQKKEAKMKGSNVMQSCLNEEFVYNYMKRVTAMGLPHGKLTIDDGWDVRYDSGGQMRYGNWDIDRNKFPHMEQLVKDMTNEGFTPGLWFAPFTVTPNSTLALRYPRLLGELFPGGELEETRKLTFLKPDPVLEKYYEEIFSRYIYMGFRKFKLDMSYGNKNEMKELLKMMYGVIKRIDRTVEVEAHIGDIFVSRFCDTVRINDVAFDDFDKWRGVTLEHYKVCRYSSPDKILNLDHIGTNTPIPKEEQYLEHLKLIMSLSGGYPCVSLLPDMFSQSTVDTFVGAIREWDENRKNEMAKKLSLAF